MSLRRSLTVNVVATVLPYVSYVVLALVLFDTFVNRVLYFLARYSVWSDVYASEAVADIGLFSFIFGEFASILLLLLLVVFMLRMKSSEEFFVALPMLPLLAADVLKYLLRTPFQLSTLTILLNLSSLAVVLMAILFRLRKRRQVERESVKYLAYVYLSFLAIILILQHLYQLDILAAKGQTLAGSVILVSLPYLMLVNAFVITSYALTIPRRVFRSLLVKVEALVILPIIIVLLIVGILYIGSVVPQALPELMLNLLKTALPSPMIAPFLLGLSLFIFACLVLWLKSRSEPMYRQEAVGLLLVFAATFLFDSIYYYPRVVLGVVLISFSLFKTRRAGGEAAATTSR
ncbi:MAG: hypothetical protein HYY22_06780 [Thaumarchaeota archaeon]|nr:hypothetical protein [Nitrososphaerota archaeon]